MSGKDKLVSLGVLSKHVLLETVVFLSGMFVGTFFFPDYIIVVLLSMILIALILNYFAKEKIFGQDTKM